MLLFFKHPKRLLTYIKALGYNRIGLISFFILAVGVSMLVRLVLIKVETFDYVYFLNPWITHLSEKGLAALGDNFSNYNTPYLVLLWLVSHLPFSHVVDIKLISIFFDLLLAFAVYLTVDYFRPHGFTKCVAVLAVLFAPTVIQNSALWGQCDGIYTSFIVFAFYAFLKDRLNLAWILWGVAFAFKLQAIFFAPFLCFAMFYRRRAFAGPFYALGTIVLLSMLPVFFGKSIHDIINIYMSQTAPPNGVEMLAWFSPTAYQWVSNAFFQDVRKAGILVGGAVALSVVALAFIRRYDRRTILVIATASLLAIPFFLPQIHERYMYTAEIFLIITACVIPRFVWSAIAMQIVTTMAYITYFTGANQQPPIPFAILSLVVFAIIFTLMQYIYQHSDYLDITPENGNKKSQKLVKA